MVWVKWIYTPLSVYMEYAPRKENNNMSSPIEQDMAFEPKCVLASTPQKAERRERQTKLEEDNAYSLLGLFSVSMPLPFNGF